MVQAHSNIPKHEIYFENIFTSYHLLSSLGERNICAVGTLRENRTVGAFKSVAPSKASSKKSRGSFDYRCDSKVFVCNRNDNSVVNIASNYLTHEPIHKANRRIKQQTNATIDLPFLMNQYDWEMGGVDGMDRLFPTYRSTIRVKK